MTLPSPSTNPTPRPDPHLTLDTDIDAVNACPWLSPFGLTLSTGIPPTTCAPPGFSPPRVLLRGFLIQLSLLGRQLTNQHSPTLTSHLSIRLQPPALGHLVDTLHLFLSLTVSRAELCVFIHSLSASACSSRPFQMLGFHITRPHYFLIFSHHPNPTSSITVHLSCHLISVHQTTLIHNSLTFPWALSVQPSRCYSHNLPKTLGSFALHI